MDDSGRLGETVGDWGRQRGTGDRVYREQGWTTAGDWRRLRGTAVTMETRVVYIGSDGYITQGDWERSKKCVN